MAPVIGFVVKVLATKIIAGLTIKAVVIAAIKVAASYAISRALTRGTKSKSAGLGSGDGSTLTMSRDPSPARRIVYGETRVSGPMAFCHVGGDGNSELGCIIMLAAHECDQIGAFFVDDVQVYPDAGGAVTSGPFAGKLNIVAHMGDQTAADAGMVSLTGGVWSGWHVLRGITYIACRLTYDAEAYAGGLPNFSAVLRGKKMLDPRTSTTAFSRNPALILRDYLANDDYGLGAAADEIDDASFIASANICDENVTLAGGGTEPRYRCDGAFTTDAEPAAVIEQILSTMAGSLVYAGGKFRCTAGAYYVPTVSLDEGDLRGPIQYQTAAGIREVCNVVKGSYTSPADLYQPRDIPQYRDAAHIAADGEEIVADLDLAWVSSPSQAQRLAKMHEKQSRLGGTITLQCNLSAMRAQAGDTVAINNTRFGWAPKVFTVQEFRFAVDPGGALGVDLVCRETSSEVFGWIAGSDEVAVSPGLTITNPKINTGTVVIASLDNDSATVPSAADGSSPVLGPAVTTIAIYAGVSDDSANWSYSAAPSSGVAGTLVGRTWTTTGFTAESGYVDITASRSGYASISTRFVLAKARAGAALFTLVNDANCAVGTNWIQRTNGGNAWDAAAHTAESYVGGAFCSFRISPGSDLMAGLNTDPVANNSFDSIDYGWVGWSNGTCAVFASSSQLTGAFTYTAATVFSATYDGKQFQFLMDGVVKHTVAASAGLKLFFDSSIYGAGGKITNIAFGPQGAAGANGADGDDATAYWLVSSSGAMKLNGSTFTPATLTITGKSQTGTGAPGNYSARFIIAETTDGTNFSNVYTSTGDEASKTHTPSGSTVKAIRCRMYQAGGTTALLDEETIAIVLDGTNGTDGTNATAIIGSVSGGGSASSTSYVNVSPALQLTVTCDGLQRRLSFSGASIDNASGATTTCYAALYEDATLVAEFGNGSGISLGSGESYPADFSAVVSPSAASHTFSVRVKSLSGSSVAIGGTLSI